MNSIHLCGFNGFGQCDGLSAMLRQLPYFNAEENDMKRQAKYLNSLECVAESEQDKVTFEKVNVQDDSLQKHGRTTEYPQAAERKKGADKWDESNDAQNFSNISSINYDSANMFSLKCIGQFKENTIKVQHVGFTWARSALTFSSLLEDTEDCCRRVHHTVVAGFSGRLKTLQLHLPNIELLGNTVYDILLKSNENYLLLPEAHFEVLPTSIMPVGESESSADFSGVTLGSVCGATSSFVAGYDGISVGVLTSDNIRGDAKEAADGILQLKLTPIDSGLSIQHVSCGLEHTVLLSQHGGVFTFGCGSRGQLGHGALESESQPRMVEGLEGMRCVCVAAGGWHSAAISAYGDLYTWGWNESGQLGLPSPAIQQKKWQQMQENTETEEHQHGCSLHLWPEYVHISSESIILVAAACGTRHTAVLSGCGKVFTAGWNRYGQLGHHHANSTDKFLPVHFSGMETTVQQVWCGAWNTAFLLSDITS